MKRVVWSVVIAAAVVAAAVWGVNAARSAALEADAIRVAAIEDPMERIAAIVQSIQARPSAASDALATAAEDIADAAYEFGEQDALVAVSDSLLGLDLPQELLARMKGELHSGVVLQGYYAEPEEQTAYWRRARDVAIELLEGDDVPADVYMFAAGFHGYAVDFAPPDELASVGGHWLPYRMASRGFETLDDPPSQGDVAVLQGALDRALAAVSAAHGVERAVAAADSILTTRPSIAAIVNASRYWTAAETHPELALESARALGGADRLEFMAMLRSVSIDLAKRDLDAGLALALAESALGLAEDRGDSGSAFFAVGLANQKLAALEAAAAAFEASIDHRDEAPDYGDPRVQALLEVYDASGRSEPAIDLMSRVLARSVMPNEEADARFGDLLVAAGRTRDEIPALLESCRYKGVSEAPDFTLVDRAGTDVTLSDLRGRVVLLCFWSYG